MFCADTQFMYIIIADKKNSTYKGLNIRTKYTHKYCKRSSRKYPEKIYTYILQKEQQKMCSQPMIDFST